MTLTEITPAHYPEILKINRDNVEMLSPLDEQGLVALLDMAVFHQAALTEDGAVAAFLIALREGAAYQSVNYRWFSAQLGRFLYIDRIAVAEGFRGAALATRLYEQALAFARQNALPVMAAEINIEPENVPSLAFHKKLGFSEIGRQDLGGGKTVSMQTRAL